MLVTLNEVLRDAKEKHYAVGLFNTINFIMARGVIEAAEEAKSPVIIGTAEVLLPYAGLHDLAPLLTDMAKRASVPVVLHFDHGLSPELVKKAVELGFTSVMYDCSTLGYEENMKAVRDMTVWCHERGITVEGELGHVGDNGGETSPYTEPDKAAEFAAETGVDALAVAIGTAHGAYKSAPKLDFERLSQIAGLVDAPLVLHGGSGLSDEDFRRSIAGGIAKVNIFTDISHAAARAIHGNYTPELGIAELMPAAVDAVKCETMRKMELFGCVGRA